MAHIDHGPSLPELVTGLVSDISGLFRKEIQLAKAEATEKVEEVMAAGVKLAIGGVLAIGALGVLLAGIVTALAAILVGLGVEPTLANSISALIVAVVVGLIGWSSIKAGLNSLSASKLNMDRTVHSLSQDAQVVKEKF
jgi:hypothetical protein